MSHPATDYDAALTTIQEALALIEDNLDFDVARDNDPRWPEREERAARLALRSLRNELSSLAPSAQVEPWPVNPRQTH